MLLQLSWLVASSGIHGSYVFIGLLDEDDVDFVLVIVIRRLETRLL